ncbi:MAG: anti-sigma factor [Rhizobiaceae bacterium]|nr:anti-sigma factor [Rhizobiaceae bacterium]
MSEHEDRLARAGEFVLGLLDAEARAAAERDLQTDAEFRDAVDRFRRHLSEIDATADADAVPTGMWPEIARRIAAMPQDARSDRPMAVTPANQNSPAWRRAGLAASLLAGLGLGYLAGGWQAGVREPVVLVVLQTAANEPGAVFEAFADNSVRVVPLEDFAVPDGKILQVWTLYDPAVGPVSLGTMTRSEIVTLASAAFPRPSADQLYEITLEPAPGSPTGKPTGPILVKGFAKRPPR